jgi:type III secretion protein J
MIRREECLDASLAGFRSPSLPSPASGGGVGRGWRTNLVRIATVVIGAVMVASCKSDLYTNLDQRQANELVATLRQHGIPADRSAGKGDRISVSVDESRFAEAEAVLRDNGLPKQEFANIGEVFKRDGLVSSPVQERAQMSFALSQELSRTVSEIDGVLSARVHVVLPENDPLRQQVVPASASVSIRHRADMPMNELIPKIKELVQHGVPGLSSYNNVSVVLFPVPVHEPVARNDRDVELGARARGRGDSLFVADWPLYSVAALALAFVGALAFVLWRDRPRIYQLRPAAVAKAPDDEVKAP